MKLSEFFPGQSVYVKVGKDNATKVYGVAGEAWSSEGKEIIVKFPNGSYAKISEANCHLFYSEPLN